MVFTSPKLISCKHKEKRKSEQNVIKIDPVIHRIYYENVKSNQ
jgi:hypothetical protein